MRKHAHAHAAQLEREGSYSGGAAADEDEEHHRAELGPRVLDLPHAQRCDAAWPEQSG
jgi:hypothetical protein